MCNTFVVHRDGIRIRNDVWDFMVRQGEHKFTAIRGEQPLPTSQGKVIALVQSDKVEKEHLMRITERQAHDLKLCPVSWLQKADAIILISKLNPTAPNRPGRDYLKNSNEIHDRHCIRSQLRIMMTWKCLAEASPAA